MCYCASFPLHGLFPRCLPVERDAKRAREEWLDFELGQTLAFLTFRRGKREK